MQATTTTMADANTVLNVNPTVCSSASNIYAQPKTHPHPPPTSGDEQMQAQENKATHPQNADAPLVPHKNGLPRKDGDPAAPSGTATLLRLRPNRQSHLRPLPPQTRLGHGLRVLPTFVT